MKDLISRHNNNSYVKNMSRVKQHNIRYFCTRLVKRAIDFQEESAIRMCFVRIEFALLFCPTYLLPTSSCRSSTTGFSTSATFFLSFLRSDGDIGVSAFPELRSQPNVTGTSLATSSVYITHLFADSGKNSLARDLSCDFRSAYLSLPRFARSKRRTNDTRATLSRFSLPL